MATTMAGAIRQIEGKKSEQRETEVIRAVATPGREKKWAIVYRSRWISENASPSAREWKFYTVSVTRKGSFGIGNYSYTTEEAAVAAMDEYLDRAAENHREQEAREARLREEHQAAQERYAEARRKAKYAEIRGAS